MNLDDMALLRGWIKQVAWDELDDQLNADGESAKQRVKGLRRQLALKSRFYGKPEQVGLWLGERSEAALWQGRCLKALAALNGLPDPVPDLSHRVGQWFAEPVCAALPRTVQTLADLVDVLESVYAGETVLSGPLSAEFKALVRFFDDHAPALGYALAKKPVAKALPIPPQQVAPLERVAVPLALNGEHGSNRSPEPCRINASHDLDAIHSWLSLKDGNSKTHSAYKKELERLLLWAVLARGKALSSLNTDDCTAYVHFLKTLTTADSQWVTLAPAIKGQGSWKPFTYRRPKTRAGAQASDGTDPPALVLSPRSVNYAKTVIASCMDWLVKQQYLQHNNFDGIASIKFAQAKGQANNRAFTLNQMQRVFAYAEAQVVPGALDYPVTRRTLYILKLAFSTGLRIHELAAASFGDIECLEDDRGEHYFLRVVGKNSKERKTSLPQLFIEELKAYLKVRGLPSHFGFLPQQGPLIPSLRDKAGRKHLSPAGIHKVLAAFFGQMVCDLEADSQIGPSLANKLRKASAHWLRHSYGSYLANDRQVPLAYIRDELGHANISTTSLYLNTDAKQRQQVVSDAFTGV